MENGKITVVDNSPVQAAYKVTKHLFKRGTSSLVTIFYGDNATAAQADELAQLLTAKYDGDAEITVIDGGQPVYYFIIAVE
jgi:dihydroxyacetone kinase-like predicted kinase